MRYLSFYIRYYLAPNASFGMFLLLEAFFLYALYHAFIAR